MKSKFPLGWLLAIIAALTLGVIKFFGSYFNMLGEKPLIGVLWGSLIVIILLIIVLLLTKCKRISIPYKFKTFATYELLLLMIYFSGLFVTILTNNHFFVVFSKQDKIQTEVQAQIDQMNDMFLDYQIHTDNRINAHKEYLNEVKKNKNSNRALYKSELLDEYEVDDLLTLLQSDIACGDMQDEITIWANNVVNKTSGLGLLALMPRIKEINERLENTRDALKEKDCTSEKGLNGPHWDYSFTASYDILNHFKEVKKENINLWSILTTILLGIIILLPYFCAERDGRHKGLWWELTHQRQNAGGGNIGGI